MSIVRHFGELSGLSVQSARSELILLNTEVAISDFEDIPVLRHGQLTRQFEYQVGTTDLVCDTGCYTTVVKTAQIHMLHMDTLYLKGSDNLFYGL